MTEEEFLNQVKSMLPELEDLIMRKAKSACRCGAIDITNYVSDDFTLFKVFMSAMGEEIKFQYKPLSPKYTQERNNLIKFL